MSTHDTVTDAHLQSGSAHSSGAWDNWQSTLVIISDDRSTIEPLLTRLQADGHDVHVIGNGDDALIALFEVLPSLIIIDDDAPGMDARGFSQKIKNFDEARFTPLILLVAENGVAERVQAYQAGIDDVKLKPVDASEIAARVQSLLRPRLFYQNLLDENREMQAAHDAHRDAEQFYRAVFAVLPEPALAIDPAEFSVLFASDTAAQLTGYDPEKLVGLGLGVLSPGEPADDWLQRLCRQVALEGSAPREEGTIVGADGLRIAVEAGLGRAISGDRTVLILILSDLRHRNDSEIDRLSAGRNAMLRETAIAVNSRINDPLFVILNDIAMLQSAMKTAEGSIQSRLARVYEATQRIQRVTAQLSAISTVVTKEYLPGVRMLDLDESVGASAERGSDAT